MDIWSNSINESEINGIVLLDLRKAFDLVNHKALLDKLKIYRCDENTMKWFTSYLTDRKQCTKFKGHTSEYLPIKVGVPQGSILGPLLFITFMNDLPLSLPNKNIDMYADDSTLYTSGRSLDDIESTLSKDLQNVSAWCDMNKMVLNIKKTKSMLITTWQKLATLPRDYLSIPLKGDILQHVWSDKLLGVTVDQHLNWHEHVNQIHRKISSNLALLWRIRQYIPIDTRITFYNAFIQPHLTFCSTVWGCTSHIDRLEKLQRRAARIIFNADYRAPTEELFKQLKWVSVREHIKFRRAVMVYNSVNGLGPKYMTDLFNLVSSVHTRSTRNTSEHKLYVPKPNLEFYKKSFRYIGAKEWNQIDCDIRSAKKVEHFKSQYKQKYF